LRFISIIILGVALLCSGAQAQTKTNVIRESDPSSWKEFNSKEGKFSISLPGAPKVTVRPLETSIGKLTTHAFTLEGDLALYYVSYIDFPVGPETPEDLRAGLDSSRDQAVSGGGTLISENDVWLGEVLGREILVKKGEFILHARYFFTKKRLFQTIITAAPQMVFKDGELSSNPSDFTEPYRMASKKFFESFKIIKVA